jgi:glutamate--cysteine ligase
VVEPLVRKRTRLGLKDFDPCTILLNNDLRAGVPRAVQNLHEQYLLPPLHAGWAVRRKSTTSRATRKWPRSSPSCWAWTRG